MLISAVRQLNLPAVRMLFVNALEPALESIIASLRAAFITLLDIVQPLTELS